MVVIEKITIRRVFTPLMKPYQLSYGPVEFLDSIFCGVELEDGRLGWGESSPLPGYCPSNGEDVWDFLNSAAPSLVGKETSGIDMEAVSDGFLNTALLTAVEEACLGAMPETGEVPLIGLVQGDDPEGLLASLEACRQLGYREFKMKAGVYPCRHEAELIREVQQALNEGEWIRLDANQGMDLESARIVAAACDPDRVRYLEQPLREEDWEGSAVLVKSSPIPIALDEAITGLESLDKTARTGAASFIKLKWMKQGSAARLEKMVLRAREHGFGVIFGNGVATGWNGRQEAAFWLRHLAGDGFAGEMNGFLKVPTSLPGLISRGGCAIVTSPSPEAPDFISGKIFASKTYGTSHA